MKQTYQHTIRLLTRQERGRFYLLLFLELLVTLLDLAFLALLFLVVGHYTNTLPDGTLPTWMETFIAIHPLALAGSFLLLFALKNLLGYRVFRSQYRFIYQVATRLSERILTGWLSTPYADHVNIDSSVLIRRVSQQPVEFGHHVLRGFQQVISNSILVALTVIAIIIFDAYLFGMLLLMLLPAIVALALFSRQRLLNIRRTIRADREKTQQYLREALDGYVEANLYQRKDFFIKRYARYQEKYNAGLASQQSMLGVPSRFMEVFAVLGLFLLVVINTYILQSESLLLLIGAFIAAAYKIIPGLVRILNHLQQIRIYSQGIEELDIPEPEPFLPSETKLERIEVHDLHYSYNGQPLLQGIHFRLGAGQLTGLSAASGKGKTTLIHLLLGFLEPQSGNIYFNDHSTTAEMRRSFWPRIAYNRQQRFLIHDSIQHNISLSEKTEMKNLWEAVTGAGLHEFVNQSEKGLDTLITEEGKNISGGQRQRMMMARALYRDADLYILDEPFGELDREATNQLLEQLQSLAGQGKMVLLITHDEQALETCSKIIRLDER